MIQSLVRNQGHLLENEIKRKVRRHDQANSPDSDSENNTQSSNSSESEREDENSNSEEIFTTSHASYPTIDLT
jgi:hypothetical protein